ncbi:MAG: hypothetical protein V4548_06150 [Bacteroidota bacterium]
MKWEAKTIKHKKESRIAVLFEKDADLIERIKKVEGSRWSQSLGLWHVPDTEENRERFKLASIASKYPSKEGMLAIEKFIQHLRSKRYSESTVTTYSEALKSFLVFLSRKICCRNY